MKSNRAILRLGIFIVFLIFLAFGVWLWGVYSYGVVPVGSGVDEHNAYRLPDIYYDQVEYSIPSDNAVSSSRPAVAQDSLKVPFTSQAPLFQWDDEVFQGACEESSVIMAMHWVRGTSFTAQTVTQEISALADFQKENYGYFYDTSTRDTFNFFQDYFGYSGAELVYNISGEDIITQLDKGHVVVVPVNGQKLKNPYYVPPGPIAHMLLVVDYDKDTGEFITNDPGTRRGGGFRYSRSVFENAIQDYPTGYYEPIVGLQTAMIIIKKNI